MRTRKLKIQYTEQLDVLNAAPASVWQECLALKDMWDYAHGYTSTPKACELWMDKMLTKSQPLHSQSIQAVRKRYFEGWTAYRALQKNGHKQARPPHKDKFYQTTLWRRAAIHFKGSMLILSNGQGNEPLKVKLPKNFDLKYAIAHIAIVELIY